MDDENSILQMMEPQKGIHWERPFYKLNGNSFFPTVYEGIFQDKLPDGFNAAKIALDGRLLADLSWKEARKKAEEYIQNDIFILWEINLGLFSDLTFPLSHQSQFLSLSLSLDHFKETFWKSFNQNSLGLIIYRGMGDFERNFTFCESHLANLRAWIKEVFKDQSIFEEEIGIQAPIDLIEPSHLLSTPSGHRLLTFFCKEVSLEYISLLANHLPDAIPKYVLLDMISVSHDPLWEALLLNPEHYGEINLGIKNASLHHQTMGWESFSSYGMIASTSAELNRQEEPLIGVCIPSVTWIKNAHYEQLKNTLLQLKAKDLPFRLIPESMLITHWDGLDYLIFHPSELSVQGKRKMQGFCAAGGVPVAIEKEIGLPEEIIFSEFIDKY